VWACALELNAWRRARQDRPLVSYQALCRELAAAGPGCFGELDTVGARSVLRRYSDAWFAAAKRRKEGDRTARFPRRRRALMARRAPKPGRKGSRRWRHFRRRQRLAEARHRRRVRQAQHEAANAVIAWAVALRVGTLAVGDPRGVLNLDAGRRHNQRTRDWRIGHLITVLKDKAEVAGISLTLVDERGTSSTCPACRPRISKPPGRVLACPACQFTGHRDLSAAANIAARNGGGITPAGLLTGVTHRRAGAHLPGVAPSRRDPRRRAHHRGARGSPGRHRPTPASPT
jgi:putative transposase